MTDLEALNELIATADKVSSQRLNYLVQTLGVEKLFLSDEFNKLKQGLRYLRDNSGGGGGIQSVQAGTNVTVDSTDPLNPIVNVPRTYQIPIPRTLGVRADNNNYHAFIQTNNQTAVIQNLGVTNPNLVSCSIATLVSKVPYRCEIQSIFLQLNTSQTLKVAFYSCDDTNGTNQVYLGEVTGFNLIDLGLQTQLTWDANKYMHIAIAVDGATANRWINGALIILREKL